MRNDSTPRVAVKVNMTREAKGYGFLEAREKSNFHYCEDLSDEEH